MKPYRISGCGRPIVNPKSEIRNPKFPGLSVADVVNRAAAQLSEAGIADTRRDAETLLASVTGKNRAWIITHEDDRLGEPDGTTFWKSVERRAKREPLQHILGSQEFWGLEFIVTPEVLIPRPETEFIIEAALAIGQDRSRPARILDLCTGSGCIAISLAKELSGAFVLAIDKSPPALRVAEKNAVLHGVADRISFIEGDLFAPLSNPEQSEKMDLIVSNPPYIPSGDLKALQPEVRDYEPEMALIAGPEGTEFGARIIKTAPSYLKKNGSLIMEMGIGQAETLRNLAKTTGAYSAVEVIKDLAGIDRIFIARKA